MYKELKGSQKKEGDMEKNQKEMKANMDRLDAQIQKNAVSMQRMNDMCQTLSNENQHRKRENDQNRDSMKLMASNIQLLSDQNKLLTTNVKILNKEKNHLQQRLSKVETDNNHLKQRLSKVETDMQRMEARILLSQYINTARKQLANSMNCESWSLLVKNVSRSSIDTAATQMFGISQVEWTNLCDFCGDRNKICHPSVSSNEYNKAIKHFPDVHEALSKVLLKLNKQ